MANNMLVGAAEDIEPLNYAVSSRHQWIRVDANILKTMTRRTEEKKIVFARVDGALVAIVCQ